MTRTTALATCALCAAIIGNSYIIVAEVLSHRQPDASFRAPWEPAPKHHAEYYCSQAPSSCIRLATPATFQTLPKPPRHGLTIQNVSGGDYPDEAYNCYISYGAAPITDGTKVRDEIELVTPAGGHQTMSAANASILLAPAGILQKYDGIAARVMVACDKAGPGLSMKGH